MITRIPPELTGVLIGVLATIAVTVLTALLQRITEHRRWLREERLNAYADISAIATRVLQHHTTDFAATEQVLLDLHAAAARGTIVTAIAHAEIATIVIGSTEHVIASRNKDAAKVESSMAILIEAFVQLRTKARVELKIKPSLWTRVRRRFHRRNRTTNQP